MQLWKFNSAATPDLLRDVGSAKSGGRFLIPHFTFFAEANLRLAHRSLRLKVFVRKFSIDLDLVVLPPIGVCRQASG